MGSRERWKRMGGRQRQQCRLGPLGDAMSAETVPWDLLAQLVPATAAPARNFLLPQHPLLLPCYSLLQLDIHRRFIANPPSTLLSSSPVVGEAPVHVSSSTGFLHIGVVVYY
ncbi:hypothetical protein LMH87_005257 [Akanthomyces muscarius]|uniref:Uncharacterized protein n=1 Tax=Akanthomyces muscarius TaxID=2231603 RepID=A0A9W8QMX2_AKAMU|nr:hypothetical protein LMH87_005257 [Akanthomyces muscarius]KAJ4163536.1 hypothetical protein LMH87_005257 [Akanthomyces muscarius]